MIGYFEGFDYGGGVAEKDVVVVVWPTTGNRVCLVDADLLPYRVGFVIGELPYLEAIALVEAGHCKTIKDTPQFESAFELLCTTLNSWVRRSNCDAALLFSTKSDANFRLDIAYSDDYKGQRTGVKPPFFNELKEEMTTRLGCLLADGIEADDWLSIKTYEFIHELGVEAGSAQHKEFANSVVASSDKDSTISAGWNFNPDNGKMQWVTTIGDLRPKYVNKMVKAYETIGTGKFWARGEKAGQEKTKRVCVGERPSEALKDLKGSGLMFFYAQVVMGDTSDNYRGITGKGKTTAYELLRNCKTEKELYMKVLGLYQEAYGKGLHWCPHFKGTEGYFNLHKEVHGTPPDDWSIWKGRGAWLSAYDRMLEQGRLAWMMQYEGDIWRKDKGRIINANDLDFWRYYDEANTGN